MDRWSEYQLRLSTGSSCCSDSRVRRAPTATSRVKSRNHHCMLLRVSNQYRIVRHEGTQEVG